MHSDFRRKLERATGGKRWIPAIVALAAWALEQLETTNQSIVITDADKPI